MIHIQLFFEFFRIGLFALGGGLATIPFLEELIDKYGWITQQDLLDLIAIAESTPGPIGVNAATYVGYNVAGLVGSLTTVLGLVTPSVIIIIVIAHFFTKFKEQRVVQAGFYGIRPVVAGLIGAAGFQVAQIALFNVNLYQNTHVLLDLFNIKAMIVCGMALLMMSKWKKHPIFYIIIGAVAGIVLQL